MYRGDYLNAVTWANHPTNQKRFFFLYKVIWRPLYRMKIYRSNPIFPFTVGCTSSKLQCTCHFTIATGPALNFCPGVGLHLSPTFCISIPDFCVLYSTVHLGHYLPVTSRAASKEFHAIWSLDYSYMYCHRR